MTSTPSPSLRVLAEQATKGRWLIETPMEDICFSIVDDAKSNVDWSMIANVTWDEREEKGRVGYISRTQAGRNAAYIAAANPSTVIALLDEIEALRKALVSHAHDLIEHSEALSKAIDKAPVNRLYALPWNEISWGRDMANRAVETIEGLVGELCLECRGRGIIRNPDARYEMDNDTGAYETNDEEEVECPRCDGSGLEPARYAARAALNGEKT
jgi:hypothetical protein